MPKSGQLLIMCSITKLCIYSQNVHKNYALVDTFLESQKDYYDIFFVQELFFFFFVQKFIMRCSIAVRGRLSTTSSLHGSQGPECILSQTRDTISIKEEI